MGFQSTHETEQRGCLRYRI